MQSIDLSNPDQFVDGPPHHELDQLRSVSPTCFQPMAAEPGFWAVLTHAECVAVSKEPNLFSASEGGVVLENLDPSSLAVMRDMLLAMDPPRHQTYRRELAPSFRARAMNALEGQIRTLCRSILDTVTPGEPVEFVHDVCAHLPSNVVGELMDIPVEDRPLVHSLAEQNTGNDDERAADDAPSASVQMAIYAMGHAARKRDNPGDDWTTLILNSEFGDEGFMTDADFGSFFVQLVTAGNDTTRTMLSSGILALLEHPEQLEALRNDPSLIGGAVEEILRWANPLHYFRRTATADTDIAGQPIKAGEKVVIYYTAANRDPEVFEDPHAFDISRSPNPHLSFGIAEHFCLGVHLARLEGRVFFEELLSRFADIGLAGEPVRLRSNLNNSWTTIPLVLG